MQRQQVESLINSNTKYQALLTETERKLAQAAAAADEARDTVSSSSSRSSRRSCAVLLRAALRAVGCATPPR